MKSLRLLLLLVTALAITRVGKADDFQMVVIDPPPILIPLYDILPSDIGQPFSVSFSTSPPTFSKIASTPSGVALFSCCTQPSRL